MKPLLVRVVAAVFAVSWLVFPGFGLIDLSVTWNPSWPQVLEAGWGVFATIIVALPFVVVAWRPGRAVPATVQPAFAAIALSIAALVAQEPKLLVFGGLLAVQTVVVIALAGVPSLPRRGSSPVLLAMGLLAAGPWLAYALHMWARDRESRGDSDITLGVDHYSLQGALALTFAVLPLLAALWAELRPFVPLCVALAAGYLAVVSLGWPDAAGGLGRTWSIAAVAWAAAVGALSLSRR